MEPVTNFETQNLNQNILPVPPQKNIYKVLFFIFLVLFLVVASVLTTLLISKSKTPVPVQELTTIPSPTEAVKEETNILKISDIQMDLPKGWTVSSVSGDTAKILTDNQISILLKIYKTTHNPSYQVSTKTPYGEVWSSACVSPLCYGASINTTKYGFNFSVENDPSNLTGEFIDKYNISLETIFNIIKTARPLDTTLNSTQDWKTYTNSANKYSIQYSNQWIFREFPDISDGAGFRLSTDVGKEIYQDDNWIEFIYIDLSGREGTHLNTPFDEYVKIAAKYEIEGEYETINNIEKITTKYGDVGYRIVWNIRDRKGNKTTNLPITYFDSKNNKNDTIQISLYDEKYTSDYDKMIRTFRLY